MQGWFYITVDIMWAYWAAKWGTSFFGTMTIKYLFAEDYVGQANEGQLLPVFFFFPVTFFYARDISFLKFVTGFFSMSREFFLKLSRAFWKCHGHKCHGHMSRALLDFLKIVTGILKMSRALFNQIVKFHKIIWLKEYHLFVSY